MQQNTLVFVPEWNRRCSARPVAVREIALPQVETSPDDFWPEVSSLLSRQQPAALKPENSQGRVLVEILLLLGSAGVLAAAAALWLPGPY